MRLVRWVLQDLVAGFVNALLFYIPFFASDMSVHRVSVLSSAFRKPFRIPNIEIGGLGVLKCLLARWGCVVDVLNSVMLANKLL